MVSFSEVGHAMVNSFSNNLRLGASGISSLAVAFAIYEVAHKIFNIKEGTFASLAAKTVAFAAGVATSFYLFSKVKIVDIPTEASSFLVMLIPGLQGGALLGMLDLTGRSIMWIGVGAIGAFVASFRPWFR